MKNQKTKFADRPFPRKCGMCGNKEVVLKTFDYPIECKRNNKLYSFIIYGLEIPTCQSCGERFFDVKIDDNITKALDEHIEWLGEQERDIDNFMDGD